MDEALVNRKPLAIMLNNIKVAQPQQGNSQADIIYEVLIQNELLTVNEKCDILNAPQMSRQSERRA